MNRSAAAAAFLALAVLSGCAGLLTTAERPHVDIVSIAPKEMRLLEQTFAMELRIQNPGPSDLKVDGMSFALEINGQPFARGVSNKSFTVERLSTYVVTVDGYTGLTSLLRQLSELKKMPSSFKYRLSGTIYLGSPTVPIPFDEAGEIK